MDPAPDPPRTSSEQPPGGSRPVLRLTGNGGSVVALAASATGNRVASFGADKQLRLWESEGLVQTKYGRVFIEQPAALAAIAYPDLHDPRSARKAAR